MVAAEYVRYYEYLDLSLFVIPTDAVAINLNAGDGTYRKAAADNGITALKGQVWIRYKRATWNDVTSADAWVYYYYGNSTVIDLDNLPSSLSTAIESVVRTIVNKGEYVYLTSDNNGLDANDAPFLAPEQIHTERITAYKNNVGQNYLAQNVFTGDSGIYNSFVTPAGYSSCVLATAYNFVYGEYTRLFYARDDGYGNPVANEFKELREGVTFASQNMDGGVYWIRECDENGVRDYRVYIDKTAPTVSIAYVSAKNTSNTMELDASVDGLTLNGKSLSIVGFGATEIDPLAYVAVYKKNGVLVNVYRADDIPTGGVEIPEGQYYFVVLDRSGNKYTVNFAVNMTELVVKTYLEENRFIRLACNRDVSEIKTFEIYLDDKLIASNYSSDVTYYEAGYYDIRIADWYGNVFNYTYELKRELPRIEWYYENGEGKYSLYSGGEQCFGMTKTSEREYLITTGKAVMFAFDSSLDYEYYFDNRSIAYTQQVVGVKTRIKVSQTSEWSVRVQYRKFPDVYVVYRCVTDVTAPVINVIAKKDIVTYYDKAQVEAAGMVANENSARFFSPNSSYFAVTNNISGVVQNNSTVRSSLFTVRFSDVSVCTEVEVYLNGRLLNAYNDREGVQDIALSRTGDYKIVARDALGNESVFVFSNADKNTFEYTVDGIEREVRANPASYFAIGDSGVEYTPDAFGHIQSAYRYSGGFSAVFVITIGDEPTYLRYDYRDGVLSEISYRLEAVLSENGNYVLDESGNKTFRYAEAYTTLIPNVNELSVGEKIQLFFDENSELALNVTVSDGKVLYFYVTAPQNERAIVDARFEYDDDVQPYFSRTILSAVKPEIVIELGDENERINVEYDSGVVYLNDKFHIADDLGSDIEEVSVCYSETGVFYDAKAELVYSDGQYSTIEFEDEGHYLVRIDTVYGASVEFRIIFTTTLQSVVKATYSDGTSNVYSAFDNVIKSSASVEIEVFTESMTYTVSRKNSAGVKEYSVQGNNGICLLTFTENDEYTVVVRDNFSNELTFKFVIDQVECAFEDDYLMGFNDKALKLDQGYTNLALSINAEKAIAGGVKAASLVYEGNTYVLFDLLSERGVEVDLARLTDCVGRYGDGRYVVSLRNEYGMTASRTIYYKGTSSVTISRLIRTSYEPQMLNVDDKTIYSNYSVIFNTTASLYEVKVDGNKMNMPLTLRFPSDKEENGEYTQTVTYIDEYGFEYEWEVCLVRKELKIDLNSYMELVEIGGVTYTQKDVAFPFDGVVSCEYSFNGGEKLPYLSGQKLTSDGTYRFSLTDMAGNVFSSVVVKDTVVEYAFTYAGSDRELDNGCVVNSGSVKFVPVNRDSARIAVAVLNGEEYDGTATTTFGENGKWEFIVEDDVGNRSYFYFFILTDSTSHFEYETPYLYKIVSLTCDRGDGVAVSYLDIVQQNENNSKMVFDENGVYEVTASSSATGRVISFAVTIDKLPPKVKLVGVENGGKTTENVTVTGCVAGDVVRVYKDDTLIRTLTVTSSQTEIPSINEKGNYRIVVTNAAGNSVEMTFERKYTANTSTTVFVSILFILIAIGLAIGLIYRTRMRV